MTTITNDESVVVTTMDEVQTFMTNNSISITESIELSIDQFGYVSELITDATFTAPQIAAFRNEFFNKRSQGNKGDDVASGGTITLTEGNYFNITGTTSIDFITTTLWRIGTPITLQFDSGITLNHDTGSVPANTDPLFLDGNSNVTFVAGSTLTLVYDDAYWREISRMTTV